MAAEPRRTGEQSLPRRIRRYEAFLQIGAGGMARVYLAVLRGQAGQKAELVVVKILRPEAVEDENVLALFTDEARIAMRLQHANVIRTREVIAEPPDYLLAMDFQNGQSLLDVVRRLGRAAVPLDEHIYILSKVLTGLAYAHELEDENGRPFGIVHRDVSPANVLVSYAGEVKLLDFGIAKAAGALAATQDGVVKGKVGYAAPEQCLGKPADPRSDVYAVGVMLWEAIAGRRRASGETWQSVLQARLEDAEPKLEDVCPDAPETLRNIVRKALARNPDDRYSTAREFQDDLRKYLGRSGGPPIGPPRVAAMLKPHFDKDRADLHRAVESFLNTLRSKQTNKTDKTDKADKPRRIRLPGAAAGAPASVPRPAAPTATPIVEEEHTAPIPVDAALLMLSRGETSAATEVESSRPTAPPARSPVAQPAASSSPTSPPESSATTARPPADTAITAPPPPDAPSSPPRAALPSTKPERAASEPAPPLEIAAPDLGAPAKSSPVATDAYGLITAPRHVTDPMLPAGMDDISLYKKKTPVWPFLLAAAAALGGGAFVLVPRHGASKEPAAVAPQPTATAEHVTPAAAPQEAPKVETVKVRISVDPADAIVKLDGRILSARPFVAALPKDNAFHELTAFADGCRDGRQTVHLNRDVAVLVSLKCSGQAARSALRTAPLRSFAGAPSPAQPQAAAAEPQPAAPAAEPAKDPQPPPAEPAPPAAPPDENPYKSEVFRKSL